jgi:hypothetical protein
MRDHTSAASEGDDCATAVTAERIGGRQDAAQRRGDRDTIQFRQHRVRGRALAITGHNDRDLFGGQSAFGRNAASPAGFSRQARSLALE